MDCRSEESLGQESQLFKAGTTDYFVLAGRAKTFEFWPQNFKTDVYATSQRHKSIRGLSTVKITGCHDSSLTEGRLLQLQTSMDMVLERAGYFSVGLLIDDVLPELRRLINVPLHSKHCLMKTYGERMRNSTRSVPRHAVC